MVERRSRSTGGNGGMYRLERATALAFDGWSAGPGAMIPVKFGKGGPATTDPGDLMRILYGTPWP